MRNIKISVVRLLLIGFAMLMLGNGKVLAQVSVTLPTITGQSGTTATASINTGQLTAGNNVLSFQFTLTYDKSVVYLTGATQTALTQNGLFSVNPDTANGRLLVAWANSTPLVGQGALVNISFAFRNAGNTALVDNGTFRYNAGTPAVTVTPGSVTVPNIAVTIGTVTAVVGDTVLIPITTSALVIGNNVLSYDFTMTYNAAVLNILGGSAGYLVAGTLSAGGAASINPNNTTGSVAFAWASGTPITGALSLIHI